jgi:hypothetical protein
MGQGFFLLFWGSEVLHVFFWFCTTQRLLVLDHCLLVVDPVLLDILLFLLNFSEDLVVEEGVFVVVEYVVLVLVDDVHSAKHVEGVVDSALDVLEVDSLSFLYKAN